MAPATTSPIKILSDLGYEVWEMESDADMLRALVDAINSLDPSDGRIPILQDAVKEIRGASRAATPSKAQKITEKKTRIKASKFIPRAKPAPKPKANPVAMLPPAQEDNQSIFAGLLNGLKGIASLLKNIAALLGVQFVFKKLLAARKRRSDALALKKEREEGLEGDKDGLGKKIKDTITKPIKSFWDTLLNFFKNILLGSAVLGFYKWMKDPKNLETIQGIADWFNKYGKAVLITLGSLLALDIGVKVYRLVKAIRGAIQLLKLGELLRRIPWWKTPQAGQKAGQKLLGASPDIVDKGGQILSRATKGQALLGGDIVGESAKIAGEIAGTSSTRAPATVLSKLGDDITAQFNNFLSSTTKNITGAFNPKKVTEGLLNLDNVGTDLADKVAAEAVEEQMSKLLTEGMTQTVAKSPTAFLSKGATEVLPEFSGMSGAEIMKFVGNKEALKKLFKNGFISKMQYKRLLDLSAEMPDFGKAFAKGQSTRVMSEAAKQLGPWGMLKRTLPIISTGLDAWSSIEELQKGNLQASLLFAGGAVTSLVAPWWSLGLSLGGIAESVRADRAREVDPDYQDSLSKYLKDIKFAPHMVTPQLMDFYSLSPMNKKKKDVKIVLAPTDTGDTSSSSGSGATNSDIQEISSVDQGNDSLLSSVSLYGALNYA